MKTGWSIHFANEAAEGEILELTPDLKARFLHVTEMIREFGPVGIGMPHVRPLRDKLWEIRLKGKDNIARSIFVAASGKRVIILHTFIKKTEEPPRKALEMAKKRAREIIK